MAASISFQATDTDSGTISDNGTYTFTLTVASAAGQERLVAVGGIAGNISTQAIDFDALTVDGQTGTRVGSVQEGADDGTTVGAFVTFYRAAGTSGTSINVVATFNGASCFAGWCAVWSLNDADTLMASTGAATNDPTLNVNTATGGCAAAIVLGYNGTTPTAVWSGLTEVFDAVRVFGDEVCSGASANIATGETPRAISVNISPDLNAGGDSVASLCVSFNPDVVVNTNWTLYNEFKKYLGKAEADLDGQFRISLFTSASNAATATLSVISEVTNEVSEANGYSSSGKALTETWATGSSAGEFRFDAADPHFDAVGGNISNVKYAVIWTSGASAGARKLVCYAQLSTAQFNITSGRGLVIQMDPEGIFELS